MTQDARPTHGAQISGSTVLRGDLLIGLSQPAPILYVLLHYNPLREPHHWIGDPEPYRPGVAEATIEVDAEDGTAVLTLEFPGGPAGLRDWLHEHTPAVQA